MRKDYSKMSDAELWAEMDKEQAETSARDKRLRRSGAHEMATAHAEFFQREVFRAFNA
jgi:hypothetical protein